jgi:hypothetical protein
MLNLFEKVVMEMGVVAQVLMVTMQVLIGTRPRKIAMIAPRVDPFLRVLIRTRMALLHARR